MNFDDLISGLENIPKNLREHEKQKRDSRKRIRDEGDSLCDLIAHLDKIDNKDKSDMTASQKRQLERATSETRNAAIKRLRVVKDELLRGIEELRDEQKMMSGFCSALDDIKRKWLPVS